MTQEEAIASSVKETQSSRWYQLYVVWDGKLQDWVTRETWKVRSIEMAHNQPGGSSNAATHLVTLGNVFELKR